MISWDVDLLTRRIFRRLDEMDERVARLERRHDAPALAAFFAAACGWGGFR